VDNNIVDSAIRQSLSRALSENRGSCPDPNLTAAYLENRLHEDQRAAFEAHAADCADCREILALALRLEEEQGTVPLIRESSSRKLLFRFTIPVSALALIVAGIALGIIFFHSSKTPVSVPAVQITQLRAPDQLQSPTPEKESKEKAERRSEPRPKPVTVKSISTPSGVAEPSKKPDPSKQALAQPAPPAATPTPTEIVELDAAKIQTREVSAAKSEFAAGRAEDAGLRQAPQTGAAATGFAGGAVGGVLPQSAALRTQRVSMLNAAPSPRDAIIALSKMLETAVQSETRKTKDQAADLKSEARSRKIGDHNFFFTSGYWIDALCAQHADAPVTEVRAGTAEFEAIVKLYPDVRSLLPAIVYWGEKTWVLR